MYFSIRFNIKRKSIILVDFLVKRGIGLLVDSDYQFMQKDECNTLQNCMVCLFLVKNHI